MSDLAITLQVTATNPVLGDLELDATLSKCLLTNDPSYVIGRDIIQAVFIRLRFVFGEWFLDQSVGIPYFKYIFVANPDIRLVESIFRRAILLTPGIASLSQFSMAFDRAARTVTPLFKARMVTGHVFTSADFGPFIVAP